MADSDVEKKDEDEKKDVRPFDPLLDHPCLSRGDKDTSFANMPQNKK